MLALESNTILSLEQGVVLHSIPDQDHFFVFSVVSGDEFRLNQTSFWVLETISTGIKWDELKKIFIETFDVAPQQGESDLLEIVGRFLKERIIWRHSDGE